MEFYRYPAAFRGNKVRATTAEYGDFGSALSPTITGGREFSKCVFLHIILDFK